MNQGRIYTPFYGEDGVIVKPGPSGGANWPPSSYDPERQTLFVCATDQPGYYSGGLTDNELAEEGEIFTGGPLALRALLHTASLPLWIWRLIRLYGATAGKIVVIVVRQQQPVDWYLLAAMTVGLLRLIQIQMQLWEFQTDAGLNTSVSVFEHEGQQYVAAFSGGNLFANSRRGDSIWLFS